MPRRFRRLDWGLGAVSVILAVAAVAASASVLEQQRQLISASRYNSVFDINQASNQLSRLESDLAASLVPDAGVSRDDVLFRVEVLANHVGILNHGEVHGLLQTQTGVDALLTTLSGLIAELRATDRASDMLIILKRLRALNAPLARMASLAHETSGDAVHRYQIDLSVTYWSMFGIMLTLVTSGFMLVGVLVRRSARAINDARTDALTGLSNRRALYAFLEDWQGARGSRAEIALLLLDLDCFKAVNDGLGHAAGDEVLVEVARRLSNEAGRARLIARLGGDEFAIVLCGRHVAATAQNIAERICADITRPMTASSTLVKVGVSVGITTSRSLAGPALDLLQQADLALYAVKFGGRGHYRFYTQDMHDKELSRQALERDLFHALERRQFELWFQPIVDIATGRTVSGEALIRWRHPVHGLVSPATFIPIAEETGLIEAIGAWVIDEACRIAVTWPAEVRVSVNLSARQLQKAELVQDILAAFSRSGMPAQRLEFEVTESMLICDVDKVSAVLSFLRLNGSRIALDDFGTGFASLSYLDRFPFDKIKIDQCFIRSAATKRSSAAVIKAVAMLADQLGSVVTAEGIETEEQLATARDAGCREGQGYLFARPMSATEFRLFLQSTKPIGHELASAIA